MLNFACTDKNKEVLTKYTDNTLLDEIKSQIKTSRLFWCDKPGNYDEKYIKIKFNADYNLPLNKNLKLHNFKNSC